MPDMEIYHQALDARDARFDGIFFVGITSTGIYCRPVCPARVSYPNRRRFFNSAAAAEQAGYRPCLRCRPELAPGRGIMDAIPRLATVAAHRISAGALNGRGVPQLAQELGVSERHLRRALEREIGVSPVELAQTCRLLLAKRLLAETSLPVTRIAFASGFQSLRRFNTMFRERYRMSPRALRRSSSGNDRNWLGTETETEGDFVRLSLAYRAPFDWDGLLGFLRCDAVAGVETVESRRYSRTIAIGGKSGIVMVESKVPATRPKPGHTPSLTVAVSASLLPVLMPLLARIRQILDLDAEPTVVDGHLERAGLASLVRQHPGLRIPGALDGFEAAFRVLLREQGWPLAATGALAERVARLAGQSIETGMPQLTLLMPDAARVAEAGVARLVGIGVPVRQAEMITAVARAMADRRLRLEQGCDVAETLQALLELEITGDLATMIIMQALPWPDAFPASDPYLLRSARESTARKLEELSGRWRPWRAYAAYHLWSPYTRHAG